VREIPTLTDVALLARHQACANDGAIAALSVLLAAGHRPEALHEARDACAYYAAADLYQEHGWFDALIVLDAALDRLHPQAA
jgi:hypothetical protein